MWIAQQFRRAETEPPAAMGVVSISADKSAVLAEQEHRELPVLAPAGLLWRPAVGTQVLMQNGCVLGCPQEMPEKLAPGELMLQVGSGRIHLTQNGQIHLTGQIYINGQLLGGEANAE